MQSIVDWLIANATLLSAIATVFALLGIALNGFGRIKGVVARRRTGPPDDEERPAGMDPVVWATQKLASTTRQQWLKEAGRLGLLTPTESGKGGGTVLSASLIRIGWSVDAARMPIHPGDKLNRTLAVWGDNPSVDQLADFFNALPTKAMVVLGSPQAGKSAAAVLLTLGLLDQRTADTDAVPVKFSLANWDRGVTLEAWLAERLLEDHPGFRSTSVYGDGVVEKLLRSGLVLPILDGLDELPGRREGSDEDERDRIIQAINDSDLPSRLILTCQQHVYDDLDSRLREAVVVKLAGVSTDEARRYIKNAALETKHPERWLPVLENLRDVPNGPLAIALSSPLMVYLIARVYREPGSSPDDLLAYRDPPAIEEHLLRGFVPAVFPMHPDLKGGHPWRSTDARRWLGHLAAELEARAVGPEVTSPRFGWWELSKFGRPATAVIAGIVGGLVGGAAVGLAFVALFNRDAGLIAGTVAAILLGLLSWRNNPPKPSETQSRTTVGAILRSGLAIGIIVFIGGALSRDIYLGIVAGIGFGVPIAILYGLTEPDPTLRPLDAGLLLRRDIQVGVKFGLTYGVPAGITGWFLTADPLLAALVGVSAGLAGAVLYGPIWILAAIAPIGGSRDRLKAVGVVAFVHLAIATVTLARAGKLPWRVMGFLDRAHDLGVLRMVSGSYEFRHRALQKVLAAEYEVSMLTPNASAPVDPRPVGG